MAGGGRIGRGGCGNMEDAPEPAVAEFDRRLLRFDWRTSVRLGIRWEEMWIRWEERWAAGVGPFPA
jgi:hypothetical protein